MAKELQILYEFRLPDDRVDRIEVLLDSETMEIVDSGNLNFPAWTKLDFCQCENCPLEKDSRPDCPMASSLSRLVATFSDVLSYEKIEVKIQTENRTITCKTDAQKGISSLMGLVNAASGCPHTAFFRPMGRFHLPMSEMDETYYRASSMYLLAQYLRKIEGLNANLELNGLDKIYRELHIVNTAIADRLRAAAEKDSSVNALVILDLFAQGLPAMSDEHMNEFRTLFKSYLED